MRTFTVFTLSILVGCLLAWGQAFTVTTVEDMSWEDDWVFIPCANDGDGEWVVFNGTLHSVTHTTIDDADGVHVFSHLNPKRITGEGESTGDTYQNVGALKDSFSVRNVGFPFEYTRVVNFKAIGPGPGNNFLFHVLVHKTINANGEVTTSIQNIDQECK